MNGWKKVFAIVTAVILAFVSLVGAVEWFSIRQRDWDIWLMSHRAEVRFEEEAGRTDYDVRN